jgi:hypothetical protein
VLRGQKKPELLTNNQPSRNGITNGGGLRTNMELVNLTGATLNFYHQDQIEPGSNMTIAEGEKPYKVIEPTNVPYFYIPLKENVATGISVAGVPICQNKNELHQIFYEADKAIVPSEFTIPNAWGRCEILNPTQPVLNQDGEICGYLSLTFQQ